MRYKAIENVLSNTVTSYQDRSGSLGCVGARLEVDQLESVYGYPGAGGWGAVGQDGGHEEKGSGFGVGIF